MVAYSLAMGTMPVLNACLFALIAIAHSCTRLGAILFHEASCVKPSS